MTASKAWMAAIYGGIGSGLSSLGVVLVGDATLTDLTQGQWLAIAIAVFANFGAAFGLVYHTSNAPAAVVAVPPVTTVTSNYRSLYVNPTNPDGLSGTLNVPPAA